MKILLIDDREKRQIKFSEETGINLEDYKDILDNFTADRYEELLRCFREGNFEMLDNYDVIITHRSAYSEINTTVIDKFKHYCTTLSKSLVFFSGGISSTSINNNFLLMNSKNFYSHNLKLFLENSRKSNKNLMILAFGENWKINLLMNSLEKLNLFVGKNKNIENISYIRFEAFTKIDLIMDFISFQPPQIHNHLVKKIELEKLINNLSTQIKQQVVLHV